MSKFSAFDKVTECPKCGAPLKVENTPEWVIWSCSEVSAHHVEQMPSPERRQRLREKGFIDSDREPRAEASDNLAPLAQFLDVLQSVGKPKHERPEIPDTPEFSRIHDLIRHRESAA
jgi:hypothetical protein